MGWPSSFSISATISTSNPMLCVGSFGSLKMYGAPPSASVPHNSGRVLDGGGSAAAIGCVAESASAARSIGTRAPRIRGVLYPGARRGSNSALRGEADAWAGLLQSGPERFDRLQARCLHRRVQAVEHAEHDRE